MYFNSEREFIPNIGKTCIHEFTIYISKHQQAVATLFSATNVQFSTVFAHFLHCITYLASSKGVLQIYRKIIYHKLIIVFTCPFPKISQTIVGLYYLNTVNIQSLQVTLIDHCGVNTTLYVPMMNKKEQHG